MEIDGLKYRAVATDGDVCLGGIDWDQRIADYVAEQFKAQFKVDLHQDPAAWQSLLQEAEDAKRALSNRPKVAVHFQHDGHRRHDPADRRVARVDDQRPGRSHDLYRQEPPPRVRPAVARPDADPPGRRLQPHADGAGGAGAGVGPGPGPLAA